MITVEGSEKFRIEFTPGQTKTFPSGTNTLAVQIKNDGLGIEEEEHYTMEVVRKFCNRIRRWSRMSIDWDIQNLHKEQKRIVENSLR